MSLRVNLILQEEQRSASKLTMKSILRISAFVVPMLFLLLIGQQALSSFMINSQLDVLESQWNAIEPKQKQALRLKSRLNFNLKTKAEIDAWAAAKPVWHRILMALMEAVPESIQLTSLRITQVEETAPSPKAPSPLSRQYQIRLEGSTRDENSMLIVQTLEKNIREHEELKPLLESIRVANFAADISSDDVWSRVFTIDCRLFELPPKEKR